MFILEWNKSFAVGIEEFDEHHKHLIDLLNEAYNNFITGASHQAVGESLGKILDYATYHFSAEEHWMELHGYAGLPLHHAEHEKFTRRVLEIIENFHESKSNLSLEILNILKNWLFDHILKTDAYYGEFAKSQKTSKSSP